MFRLLPWSSSIGGNKVMAEEVKMLATAPPCASAGVNGLSLPQLKRKRSDSGESATDRDAPVATKLRPDDATPTNNATTPVKPTSSSREPTSVAVTSSQTPHRRQGSSSSTSMGADQTSTPRKMNVEKLRETLEAQLSLEVLLKHNELRLIDQEIAKCQVAMEQLRRCAEIPYPGSNVAGVSQSVSNGTGMSVLTPGNGPAPLSPAPWGVVDGPYTRHYAKWLIPDPRFDGGEIDAGFSPVANGATGFVSMTEGRSTRGNPGDVNGFMAGKTRPSRNSAGAKLQALPNGYPAPKERAGPMIIRRKSDGMLVKLVCLDCRRDNFSSTQGFINHCRIAHNRNFASHDAAATASGEPVEVDDAGAIVGGKTQEAPIVTAPGYVHPLVRSAHVIEPSTTPSAQQIAKDATPQKQPGTNQASSTVETPRPTSRPRPRKRSTPGTVKASNASFMASPATPHLSSLMQVRGVGLDLDQLVGEAKTSVDLGAYSSEEAESEDDSVQPMTDTSQDGTRAGRQPMRTTTGQTASQRPSSRKGLDKMGHKLTLDSLTPSRSAPYTSPYGPAPSLDRPSRDELDQSANLSPNTLESNQAPSLVSDDDDYEMVSDSESPGPSSSEVGDSDQDFSHIDVEDGEDTTTSNGTADPKGDPGLAGAANHAAPLPKSLRRGNAKKKDRLFSTSLEPLGRNKEEKRVGFASPPASPAKGKKDHNRKSSR